MRAMSLAAIATVWIATAPASASAANQIIIESFSVTIPDSTVPTFRNLMRNSRARPFSCLLIQPGFYNLSSSRSAAPLQL
jgi:hypothetical protein